MLKRKPFICSSRCNKELTFVTRLRAVVDFIADRSQLLSSRRNGMNEGLLALVINAPLTTSVDRFESIEISLAAAVDERAAIAEAGVVEEHRHLSAARSAIGRQGAQVFHQRCGFRKHYLH